MNDCRKRNRFREQIELNVYFKPLASSIAPRDKCAHRATSTILSPPRPITHLLLPHQIFPEKDFSSFLLHGCAILSETHDNPWCSKGTSPLSQKIT